MNRLFVRGFSTSRRLMGDGLGRGSGKSGGSGGSIRDAGGAFGEMGAAREEEYFRKLQAAQFRQLKDQLNREVEHHESQAKNHAEVIARHKKRIAELEKEEQLHGEKK
ncbi:ATP synthase F1 subunit epsilon [Aphelenchoides fujianensis]|nr:ATP synthase F1 subunit epsilon [Aphelenchoides fujianensis]